MVLYDAIEPAYVLLTRFLITRSDKHFYHLVLFDTCLP